MTTGDLIEWSKKFPKSEFCFVSTTCKLPQKEIKFIFIECVFYWMCCLLYVLLQKEIKVIFIECVVVPTAISFIQCID